MARKSLTAIALPADPANPLEAATKQYVDLNRTSAGRIFYLTNDASDIATYYKALDTPSSGAEATFVATVSGTTDFLLAAWATEPGIPGVLVYPAGTAYRRFYVNLAGGNTARLHLQIYVRTLAGVETLARDELSPNFTNTTVALNEWLVSAASAGAMATTDRLVCKLYAQRVSGAGSFAVTLYVKGTTHASHVQTTIVGGSTDMSALDARYVAKAGDTMTGLLVASQGVLISGSQLALQRDGTGVSYARVAPVGTDNSFKIEPINAAGFDWDPANAIVFNRTTGLWTIPGAFTQATADTVYVNVTGDTMTGALQLPGNPTAALQATPKQYVDAVETRERSKGAQLVVNGSGYVGTNYNWTGVYGGTVATYQGADRPVGTMGSFLLPAGQFQNIYSDEYIPVDTSKSYVFGMWARETDGSAVSPLIYAGLQPFDIDNAPVQPNYVMYQPNTLTTLAAPLNPGNTTITLTSSTSWNNSVNGDHLLGCIFWNHVDSTGYAWPALTYSRNSYLGLYNVGGITGNVITLRVPWAGPAIASGTQVSNTSSGGLQYMGWVGDATPTTWTWRDSTAAPISGLETTGTGGATKFWYGTAKVRIVLLGNRVANSRTAFTGVTFAEQVTRYVMAKGDTMTGSLVVNGTVSAEGQRLPKITASTTAPSSPSVGDVWLDTT